MESISRRRFLATTAGGGLGQHPRRARAPGAGPAARDLVGITSELIRGDIYFWGSLMAGAVLGSVPCASTTRSRA